MKSITKTKKRIAIGGLMLALGLAGTMGVDARVDDWIHYSLLERLAPPANSSYGETRGQDNGNCTFLCTKGNYNQAFKRQKCLSGRTPGLNPVFFNGHYTYKGVKWDKMGTGQDHQGVCVSVHPADRGKYTTRRIFHDGCTGYPDGNPRKMTQGPNKGWDPPNWGQVFHGACVIHDLCYKAEGAFSGKSKAYCDDQMEKYARKICYDSYGTKRRWFRKNDRKKCLAEAANARFWLRLGSKKHYEGYNYKFDWRPNALCGPGYYYNVTTSRCTRN